MNRLSPCTHFLCREKCPELRSLNANGTVGYFSSVKYKKRKAEENKALGGPLGTIPPKRGGGGQGVRKAATRSQLSGCTLWGGRQVSSGAAGCGFLKENHRPGKSLPLTQSRGQDPPPGKGLLQCLGLGARKQLPPWLSLRQQRAPMSPG